jgi:hypothetical protein
MVFFTMPLIVLTGAAAGFSKVLEISETGSKMAEPLISDRDITSIVPVIRGCML